MNAVEVLQEIEDSSGELTEADYLREPNKEGVNYSWWVFELGVVTSASKHDKYLGQPITLHKTNVAFGGGEHEVTRPAYRNQLVKTSGTQYFVLDLVVEAVVLLPPNHYCYHAPLAETGPA